MLSDTFRKWAEHGCRQYGSDPWFFLRELAQNSRDAYARRIRVRARRDGSGREVLEFEDDGTGMSLEHARRYLFRLYASSKESDTRSAGKYGIGFWSVLRFAPTRIIVESRTRRDRWAIMIDEKFDLTRVDSSLERRGTSITLARDARRSTGKKFAKEVGRGLERYCRYLRRNDRGSGKLPVVYNDRNLTRSMRLPGPVSLDFKHGSVEGAVGLSETPSVYLHARGLPVWKGVMLDELSHTAQRQPEKSEIAHGLAPVFLLNGNDLNVVMSRRAVIDDSALARVRRKARDALARLVRLHMESTFPRSLPRRLLDGLERSWAAVTARPAHAVLAVLLVILAAVVAVRLPDLVRTPAGPVSTLPSTYSGPSVGMRSGSGNVIVDMSYEPPVDTWFKIMTADRYDLSRGFTTRIDETLASLPAFSCNTDCISVRIRLDRGGPVALPLPPGHATDTSSLAFDGSPVEHAGLTSSGDTVVRLPEAGGVLTFTTGPSPPPELDDESLESLRTLPGVSLPPKILSVLRQARRKSLEAKLVASLVTTRTLVTYDDSPGTARAYSKLEDSQGWLPLVLQTGRGDCDVLNGLNALLLRKMGVPSRLAIGLIGHEGRALAELHAWTEYWDEGWQILDATPPREADHTAEAAPVPPGTPPVDTTAVSPGPPGETPSTAAASPPEASPVPRATADPPIPAWPLLAALAAVSICIIVLIVLLVRSGRWENMRGAEDPLLAERILAKILTSATVNPRMWRHAREIWYHRILPTLEGRRISIHQARRLAGRRRLFLGSESTPLAAQASGSGAVVLDRDCAAFGPFMSRLPGVVDLDAIDELKPLEHEDGPLDRLLDEVNRILAMSGAGRITALPSPGLTTSDFQDVDLRTLPGATSWPRTFIAVNPGGSTTTRCCDLFDENPRLAAWRIIENLTTGSRLLAGKAEKVRWRSSRILVEEIP